MILGSKVKWAADQTGVTGFATSLVQNPTGVLNQGVNDFKGYLGDKTQYYNYPPVTPTPTVNPYLSSIINPLLNANPIKPASGSLLNPTPAGTPTTGTPAQSDKIIQQNDQTVQTTCFYIQDNMPAYIYL